MRRGGAAWRAALFLRGCLNLGLRFECPCCGWRIARFLHSGAVLRARPDGYCPRCNSKARHRRDWLFLQALRIETPNFRLLHIAPAWCLSRRLRPRVGNGYVAGDIADTGLVDLRFDAGDIPLRDGAVDAVVSIHVLEHVADDRAAAREIRRVLAPGGWAAITVPLSKNPSTLEDASVTSREERRRLFGEATHLRLHGEDFLDRLTEDGFDVVEHPPSEIPQGRRRRCGITLDETMFFCKGPNS